MFKCEVRSPSFLSSKFLGCNLQGAARCRLQVCKCFMGKAAFKPDHKLHIYKHILANIHELITLAYDSHPSSIGLSQDM